MSGQKITKVTHKAGDILVRAEEEANGDVIKTDIESDTPPLPELVDAFTALGKYMCDMLGFPKEWKDKHECRTVSINYEEDDRIGAVVTLYVKLEKFNNGIVINTPQLREKIAGSPGGGCFMTPEMCELVKEVRDQGQRYMDGERAQRELLDEKKGEE